ncbi:hypothetical protein HAX54_036497 [Datura stramonium]|uniref:Uncharacterized protein n=1 Tax=Datura stramonium TaxID=4076 RepID=A0ABS8VJQ5_DATST|nr:hypothetical protein [Datura stramonium]
MNQEKGQQVYKPIQAKITGMIPIASITPKECNVNPEVQDQCPTPQDTNAALEATWMQHGQIQDTTGAVPSNISGSWVDFKSRAGYEFRVDAASKVLDWREEISGCHSSKSVH